MNVSTIGAPNPPITFTLRRAAARTDQRAGGRRRQGTAGRARRPPISSTTRSKYDEAIAAYQAILAKAPALTVINLQIAAAYRNKKDYDSAIAAYNELLKTDPNNDKAKIGIGMTNLEKGDLQGGREDADRSRRRARARAGRCSTTSAR